MHADRAQWANSDLAQQFPGTAIVHERVEQQGRIFSYTNIQAKSTKVVNKHICLSLHLGQPKARLILASEPGAAVRCPQTFRSLRTVPFYLSQKHPYLLVKTSVSWTMAPLFFIITVCANWTEFARKGFHGGANH